jgi:hypothetical protein
MYCLVSLKFSVRDGHEILLSASVFDEKRCGEGHTFLTGVNEITFPRVP